MSIIDLSKYESNIDQAILNAIKSPSANITDAYESIKSIDVGIIMKDTRTLASIQLTAPGSSSFINSKGQTELTTYFMNYVIKKRATYLYMYAVLQKSFDLIKEKTAELIAAKQACDTDTAKTNALKDKIKELLTPLIGANASIKIDIDTIFAENASKSVDLKPKIQALSEELIFLRKFTTDSMNLAVSWNEIGTGLDNGLDQLK
jgi:hypothetical protein